jgi:transposase
LETTVNVALWAEIRRLKEIEKLSERTISLRLHCSRHTVAKAVRLDQPPSAETPRRGSMLEPYQNQIDALLAKHPDLSAVRIHEEIARGADGFRGSVTLVRRYLHGRRPRRSRVYQEVHYEPGEAVQVDWGDCGRVAVGGASRRVSVFVAVLCYSRLMFIEFTLSQRKADFYRALVAALSFFGGSPRKVIVDNLKAAVLNGSGREACYHPDFLALCGSFCLQPVACQRRDPESKGIVEGGVRYVKRNALAGRAEQLATFEDYQALAVTWRDDVANVRRHETTHERPVDRFQTERSLLRALPALPFDTDEVVPAVVSPHARVKFDGNRYSVPPQFVRKSVMIRADRKHLLVLHAGQVIARHVRCYDRGQPIVLPDHRLAALERRQRSGPSSLEQDFDALGTVARQFHLELKSRPVKTSVHLRRLLKLAQLYGVQEVVAALARASQLGTYDAAYVENLLLAERRRRQLPTPTLPTPQRRELIDEIQLDPSDPALYDRLFRLPSEDDHDPT